MIHLDDGRVAFYPELTRRGATWTVIVLAELGSRGPQPHLAGLHFVDRLSSHDHDELGSLLGSDLRIARDWIEERGAERSLADRLIPQPSGKLY